MAEIIFNPTFHFTILSLVTFCGFLLYIFKSLITSEKKHIKVKALISSKKWIKVKVEIIRKGYFINYNYPHMYRQSYPEIMTDEEQTKAAAFEYEDYKQRMGKYNKERNTQGVTLEYKVLEGRNAGKVFTAISVTNHEAINYEALFMKEDNIAYQLKANPNNVFFLKPTEKEAKALFVKETKRLLKVFLGMLIITIPLYIVTISFYQS